MKLSAKAEAAIQIASEDVKIAFERYQEAERTCAEVLRREMSALLPPGAVVRVVGWLKDRPDELRGVITDWTWPNAFARLACVWVQFLTHPQLGADGLQDAVTHEGSDGDPIRGRQPLVTYVDVKYLEPTAERASYWHEADRDAGVVEVKP